MYTATYTRSTSVIQRDVKNKVYNGRVEYIVSNTECDRFHRLKLLIL
jgi:hypothetical protein